MTKIETYKAAAAVAAGIKSTGDKILGRDSPRNDKHTFSVSFQALQNAPFQPMQFSIDCSYGYYGSSSGYSATSESLGRYLAKAIEKHAELLLDTAVELATKDAEKARKAAEDEARSVLNETAA